MIGKEYITRDKKAYVIDLETLGTGVNPVILSIGSVLVNLTSGKVEKEFYKKIDIDSSIEEGFNVDGSTLRWWLNQSEDARDVFKAEDDVLKSNDVESILLSFRDFVKEDNYPIYGYGAFSDNRWLYEAYQLLNLNSWDFRRNQCLRTLISVTNLTWPDFEGTPHNALDDAKQQAKMLYRVYKELLSD